MWLLDYTKLPKEGEGTPEERRKIPESPANCLIMNKIKDTRCSILNEAKRSLLNLPEKHPS